MARRPYTGRMTSAFGPRKAPIKGASTMHLGEDGIGGYNTAPEGGRLIEYRYVGGWGNRIAFLGDSGTLHYLAHNAPRGLLGRVGSWYHEGTALGIKGMTGTATGVHVHWETRPRRGAPIDPSAWLASFTKPSSGGTSPLPTDNDKDDDTMKNCGFIYQTSKSGNGTFVYLICNTGSGFQHEYSNGPGNGPMASAYNNAVATAFDTGSFATITASHAGVIKRALAEVLASKS